MILLVVACLLVNVIFTVTLPILLLQQSPRMDVPYGIDTPARRILACLYASIAAVSAFALASYAVVRDEDALLRIVMVLFPIQILYKVGTIFTVGLDNRVVKSNAVISLLLLMTLGVVWIRWRSGS